MTLFKSIKLDLSEDILLIKRIDKKRNIITTRQSIGERLKYFPPIKPVTKTTANFKNG